LTDLFSVCPPDIAMAHVVLAVLARNGIEPGS
jgi:hypothetical protein